MRARGDPSVHASYYDGLLRFLHGRQAAEGPFRIEIPFTDNHWESAHVAPTVPLARGWERQLDRKVNGLFYDGRRLTGQRYLRWLHDNAVRYVALADAPIDYSAAAEAKRIRNGDVPELARGLPRRALAGLRRQRPDAAGDRRAGGRARPRQRRA